MRIRLITAFLIITAALGGTPWRAAGDTGRTFRGTSATAIPLPPEELPEDQGAQEEAAKQDESASVSGTAGHEKENMQATAAISNQSSQSPLPVPEKKSWWKGVLGSIGIDSERDHGETVEAATSFAGESGDYIIGPGDQIGISVWRDENLSRTVAVLPDGKIYYPLIGEMIAGGRTVSQLKEELEKKLSRYISDTGVTVEVKQSNSMIVYVIGRVNAPGRQILLANTNVLQALAMVGGLNPFADKGDIKIFRRENGKTLVYPFNYNDVSEGRHLESNIDLKRGDVIIVP